MYGSPTGPSIAIDCVSSGSGLWPSARSMRAATIRRRARVGRSRAASSAGRAWRARATCPRFSSTSARWLRATATQVFWPALTNSSWAASKWRSALPRRPLQADSRPRWMCKAPAGTPATSPRRSLRRCARCASTSAASRLAEVALHAGQVREVGQHLGQVAARLAAGDRALERGGAARALVGGLQRIRHVGPEPVGVVVGRIVRQAGLVRLEQRDRLVRALRLRQPDRQIARGDALARPVVLGRGERARFVGGDHRLGGAGRHQQRLRAGELRGEALRRRRGVVEQAVGEALRLLDALDEEQRLDRVDAGAEGAFRVAALVARRDDLAPVHQLVGAARGRERVPGRRLVGGSGLGPALRGLPVHRDARRRQRAPRQLLGDLRMQRARHRLRDAGARRVEDEVVREAAVAHDLRAFELAPRIGEVERVHAEHRRGELDVEVAVGDRREAREAQRGRRQALQPALDQLGERRRRRQRAQRRRRVVAQHRAQRLEQEQRIAAAVAPERRRPRVGVDAGQAERFDQRAHAG